MNALPEPDLRYLAPGFDCAPLQAKAGAGDEARTRDVHLGKVVLYQLSYTRSFERDNNVQPTAPRNLLIAPKGPKSLNPNWAFTASYDQTLYEKTIPPLYVLAGTVWHLVSAGSDRNSDFQPHSADRSNSRDSGKLNSRACINSNASTEGNRWFCFIRHRRQDSPEAGEKAWWQAWHHYRYRRRKGRSQRRQ